MAHFARALRRPLAASVAAAGLIVLGAPAHAQDEERAKPAKPPKVVLISLDGAQPSYIRRYLDSGLLPSNRGLGWLMREGVSARQNVTANPSLTAVAHIAIATGSTAVHNDIPANSFHPVAAPIASSLSGFAAPIGGYQIEPLGPSRKPTAEPLWVKLRKAGKTVVAATWPGADGATISVDGTVVQEPGKTRVVDYTVPFGAFGGLGAVGFSKTGSDFIEDAALQAEFEAAGRRSFSPVRATPEPVETFSCSSAETTGCSASPTGDVVYRIRVAALDGTDDGVVNYDTLAFFDAGKGVAPEKRRLPSTGPAYFRLGGDSARFFLEGSGARVGTSFYATTLAPDLSAVRFLRYSAYFIPRNAPVIETVDDVNEKVGFWAPQPDFRIPQRAGAGLAAFSDIELEVAYQDQVKTFLAYQTRLARRAILANPGADLVMIYFEEPDGSTHQFLLTDRRQATDPRQPVTIGARQDVQKVRRYADYLEYAYKRADKAVQDILELTGPETTVFVVSDHGFAPFHTAVNLTNLLKNAGIDTSQLSVRTSGPAANVYVNLRGREAGGSVAPAAYRKLVARIAAVLRSAKDPNVRFNQSLDRRRLFATVEARPANCREGVGLCVNDKIGQDFGDVFAQLDVGYNFDGAQTPPVIRLGDPAADPAMVALSTPNFYGAHGHDAERPEMSAAFIAAGPGIRRNAVVRRVENIDVAPTIERLLGVAPASTVDGEALKQIFK